MLNTFFGQAQKSNSMQQISDIKLNNKENVNCSFFYFLFYSYMASFYNEEMNVQMESDPQHHPTPHPHPHPQLHRHKYSNGANIGTSCRKVLWFISIY